MNSFPSFLVNQQMSIRLTPPSNNNWAFSLYAATPAYDVYEWATDGSIVQLHATSYYHYEYVQSIKYTNYFVLQNWWYGTSMTFDLI